MQGMMATAVTLVRQVTTTWYVTHELLFMIHHPKP